MEICKSYKQSAEQKKKKEEEEKLPMLFTIPDSIYRTDRSVLDIRTLKSCTLSDPNFEGAMCKCCKQGWLLMTQRVTEGLLIPSFKATLFLMNPTTGGRIDLPPLDGHTKGPSTFSLKPDGTPDYVVYVSNELFPRRAIIIRVTRVGAHAWEEHVVPDDRKAMTVNQVHLLGTRVLCHVLHGQAIAFDLSDRRANCLLKMPYNRLADVVRSSHVLESEGEFLKVACEHPLFSTFRFHRFDQRVDDWVEMEARDLENRSWFLGRMGSYTRRLGEGQGKKVYTYEGNEYGGPGQPDFETANSRDWRAVVMTDIENRGNEDNVYNVYVHDLAANTTTTTTTLLPEDFPARGLANWVDLGDDFQI